MSASPTPASEFIRKLKRRANITLGVVVVLVPFAIVGATQSVKEMRITPEKWMSPSHPKRQQFEEFRAQFEGNDVVYVAWDECTIDDPRLSALEQELTAHNSLPSSPDVIPFERILTGSGSLDQLVSKPLNFDREKAIERLKGFLIGRDGKTSCTVIVLTYEGNEHRKESIAQIIQVAQEVTGLSENELIIAGPPHDGVTIDEQSILGVNLFGTLSTLVAGLICCFSLRSLKVAASIIGVAVLGQAIVLSAVYYSGMTLDAILIVAPPLIFVLTVSAGIHFANYFTAQPSSVSEEQAIQQAMRDGWKPCWLAAITTSVGLCSLAISGIRPVAAFGAISAGGLLVSVGLLMCLLPDALRKWPLDRTRQKSPGVVLPLSRIAGWVSTFPGVITLTFAVCIISALIGTKGLRTSVDATALFSEKTKIIRDYNWLESHIGASVPIEVVINFDRSMHDSISEQVEVISEVHDLVGEVEGIESVMSARTFLPEQVWRAPTGSFVRQALINKRLHASLPTLRELNSVFESDQIRSWRITGRVPATAGESYSTISDRIKENVNSFMKKNENSGTPMTVRYTGMMPLIESVQVTILSDLFWSLTSAFILIGLSMLWVLKNAPLSLLVTILNTFPVLIVFGFMGALSIPIDIGTMMTAGVAMGIAVDDTVHFLCFYRKRIAAGLDQKLAVRETIESCGAAMLQTSLICVTSMLVFSFSSFVPTRQFGLIMASILVTALISDLICLPALLLLRGSMTRKRSLDRESLWGPDQKVSANVDVDSR